MLANNDFIKEPFQFPTGWNSTVRALASDSELLLFQFPTGWNSTYREIYPPTRGEVSIPNWMEFYSIPSFRIYDKF